ncbi:response regulator transcription factor [Flagellimonas onchidii]|uniref:response regulator transcription factor n=1 Tax=Flagellimonas onchidii TaxID=2562684 RepID=UPI0010A600C1|nr:response regulator transcription factor [Allomuricauda onchidii]
MKNTNILIVEDEPLLCNYYKMVLNEIKDYNFNICTIHSFTTAKQKIQTFQKSDFKLDLAILDLRLRDLETKTVNDGQDLGLFIRKIMPGTRIIFITSIVSHLRFYDIFQFVNPEGFVIKDELENQGKLTFMICEILNDGAYYSKTVARFLKEQANGMLQLDQTDRILLNLLAQGIKTKNLTEHLNLSLSTIEKRKQNIVKVFKLSNTDNENLLQKAREKMII